MEIKNLLDTYGTCTHFDQRGFLNYDYDGTDINLCQSVYNLGVKHIFDCCWQNMLKKYPEYKGDMFF